MNNIIAKTTAKKTLVNNIVSLMLVQGTNYLLPLITLPYLVRVLGPNRYGLVAFAQAFTQYFITITDYGFIHTAPRRISINRDDEKKLCEMFNAVMLAKFGLMLACFLLAIIVIFAFRRFRNDWDIYLISLVLVLGNVLFPVWLFQGMEKMEYITILNLVSKLFFTCAIFLVVKNSQDYLYVPLLNSLGMIISGVISLFIAVMKLRIIIKMPTQKQLFDELREGWQVFVGMFSVNLFSSTNVVILGLFANNTVIGYFKAGDTLIRAVCGLLQPVNSAMYPHISRLAIASKKEAHKLIRKLLYYVCSATLLVSIIFIIYARQIVHIALGSQYEGAAIVVMILSLMPMVNGASGVLGVQGLLAFHKNRTFSTILTISAIANIGLALVLAPPYGHIGMATSLITAETMTLVMIVFATSKLWIKDRDQLKGHCYSK